MESTRLNATDQPLLRPNITDENLSHIPRSSLPNDGGNSSTSSNAAATAEAPSTEEINSQLHGLDISNHDQVNNLEVKSQAAEEPPAQNEDDVFNPVPQTPQEIADALAAAVGEETLDHDRSNLEANIMLGASAMTSVNVTRAEIRDHSSTAYSQQSGGRSTRSSVRSSQSEVNTTASQQSSTTTERGSRTNSSVSSQSSARSNTQTDAGDLTCDICNKKCKSKSGYKRHMKTHLKP